MKKINVVSIYSVIHCFVDLACAALLAGLITPSVDNENILFISIVLYNFFAFAVQFPIGVIADYIDKNAIISALGCLLIVLAYIIVPIPVIACIIAGIGNAMFHIGGGIDTLNVAEGKATLPRNFCINGSFRIISW